MGMLDNMWSAIAGAPSLGRGAAVLHGGARRKPEEPLVLYQFEACPYCRKVREALTELDLEHVVVPCARGSKHRDETPMFGGRRYFPYLVDPNTGVQIKESEDILDYLHETYGGGRSEVLQRLAPLRTARASLTSAARPRGRRVSSDLRRDGDPAHRLVLYEFEACPFCRRVRERLNELDLPYVSKPCGKGSPRREELRALGGKVQVPYLVDDNAGVALYETDAILRHLERYAISA